MTGQQSSPGGKPPAVTRLISSRSAFVEGLRELVRHDSVRDLLVKELGPLIRERRIHDRRSHAWRRAFFALLAVALTSVVTLWASALYRSAGPPAHALVDAPQPRPDLSLIHI